MKEGDRSKKVYYSSQNDSGWNIKKIEFQDKLNELKNIKGDLYKQKEAVNQLRRNIPYSEVQSNEELSILLNISKEEIASLKKIIMSDRDKYREMEKELGNCKEYCKELECKNRIANTYLIEKDRVLSRYLCEMLILKQEVEKLINPSSALCKNISNSLNLLYSVEKQNIPIPIEQKPEENALIINRSQQFYENEISRLQKQLSETQELYRLTNMQLKELIEKNNRNDGEFLIVKSKLRDTRSEFSQISSQIIRNSSDRDFQSKSLIVELEELKKKKDEQDTELAKIEQRYKNSLSELEADLAKSREKTLELIDSKTKLENDIIGIKAEKKELLAQIQFKELKISDLNSNVQNSTHELNMLKNFVKSKSNIDSVDIKQKNKYENAIFGLSRENEELKERIEIYESERLKLQSENRNNSKTIVQQLSNIILSRDYSGNVESKDLTKNLSRILVENRMIFEVIYI